MILFYSIVFFGSLIGIVLLFAIKMMEIGKKRTVVAPLRRVRFDFAAAHLKQRLLHSGEELARLWPVAVLVVRYFAHLGALRVARFARGMEKMAHKLADIFSHKHHFERIEPRSEYLKRMSERSAVRMMHSSR